MFKIRMNNQTYEFDVDSIMEELPDIIKEYIYDNITDDFGIHCGAAIDDKIYDQLVYIILKRTLNIIQYK